ncbi:hypothetical protein DA098_10080 [Vibrio parahaemolyticus]|nr:hypothetical protein DA098_10080 [Vibrio parahaemolyticus]TMX80307.1 hypothetical protein DA094_01895 [Vibrio parahaemolyticus]
MKALLVLPMIFFISSNVIASNAHQNVTTTDEPVYLHSVELMSVGITPCVIYDYNGNKLTFPSVESSRLVIEGRILFNKECLSFDVNG